MLTKELANRKARIYEGLLLRIKRGKNCRANLIQLFGTLEASNAEKIYQELAQSIKQEVDIIVIDLKNLKFINQGGYEILDNCRQQAQIKGIELFISGRF